MRPRRPVPSGVSETLSALDFAPTAATLERVIKFLDEQGDGAASDAALRREALARYMELPAPGARPNRGWKYDYAALKFEELRWTSGRVEMAALPARPAPKDHGDPGRARPDGEQQKRRAQHRAGGYRIGGRRMGRERDDRDDRLRQGGAQRREQADPQDARKKKSRSIHTSLLPRFHGAICFTASPER